MNTCRTPRFQALDAHWFPWPIRCGPPCPPVIWSPVINFESLSSKCWSCLSAFRAGVNPGGRFCCHPHFIWKLTGDGSSSCSHTTWLLGSQGAGEVDWVSGDPDSAAVG
jgi:hypothetical protein